MTVLARWKRNALDLLTSKKAMIAGVAVLVALFGKRLGLDVEETAGVVAACLAYVLGQGLADTGKAKAELEKE